MKKRTIIYIIIAVILVGALTTAGYFYQSNNELNKTEQLAKKALDKTESTKKNGLSYKGKNGISALVLLEQNARIITSGKGDMVFITTINGATANPKSEYWQLNVNGKSASVGAGSYITKNGETITWKLTKF